MKTTFGPLSSPATFAPRRYVDSHDNIKSAHDAFLAGTESRRIGTRHAQAVALLAFVTTAAAALAVPVSVQVPVKVNLYGDSGVTEAEAKAYLKDANKLLKQTGVTLVPVKFNEVYLASALSFDDRENTRRMGGEEIKKEIPNERGIKVSFVKQPNASNPNVAGVAVHQNPTIIIGETAGTTNGISNTGYTIAHETGHVMTNLDTTVAGQVMNGSGFNGTTFTPGQIAAMQDEKYVYGKCATQWEEAFPGFKDAEQFGAAASFSNPGGASGAAALTRVDLTSLDAAADPAGGDTANIAVRLTVGGVLPASGTTTVAYALGFDSDNQAATGISYAGQAGIDRLVYVTGTGNQSAFTLDGWVVSTDSSLFPSTSLPTSPVFNTEAEFLDTFGLGTTTADPAATTFEFSLPKLLLSSLALPSADLPAVAASITLGSSNNDPTDDTILMESTDLSFNTRAYLDDPSLTTFGTGIPTPGQLYPFSITGLTPNDAFTFLLDGEAMLTGTLDAAGAYSGSFVFPATLSAHDSYFLTAQDSSGEFAYNMTCPQTPDGGASTLLLALGLGSLLGLRRSVR